MEREAAQTEREASRALNDVPGQSRSEVKQYAARALAQPRTRAASLRAGSGGQLRAMNSDRVMYKTAR